MSFVFFPERSSELSDRHLSALGRFGETAFIAPLYGVGELPQAFCRMAAVHGAVYVLRRQLKSAVIDRTSGRYALYQRGGKGAQRRRKICCFVFYLRTMNVSISKKAIFFFKFCSLKAWVIGQGRVAWSNHEF